MDASDPEPVSEPTRPLGAGEERRYQIWAVIASFMVVVELFFDGFPEGPDAGSWGEARRPLFIVAAGVLTLVLLGFVQARWGRRERGDGWSVRPRGLGGYPPWFGFAAFGLGLVGVGLYVYAVFWSLREGGSLHVLERRVAVILLIGSVAFTNLISWLSNRDTSRGRGVPRTST